MIVISDTSPLIHLAACSHLQLLQKLYGQIVIPVSVDLEIRINCKDQNIKQQIIEAAWINARNAFDRKLVDELDNKLGGLSRKQLRWQLN